MPRSTVAIDRDLARRVDAWAERTGRPHGPGHRTTAVQDLIRAALELDWTDLDGPATGPEPAQRALAIEGGADRAD